MILIKSVPSGTSRLWVAKPLPATSTQAIRSAGHEFLHEGLLQLPPLSNLPDVPRGTFLLPETGPGELCHLPRASKCLNGWIEESVISNHQQIQERPLTRLTDTPPTNQRLHQRPEGPADRRNALQMFHVEQASQQTRDVPQTSEDQ
jgi:hypothetical protein